MTAISEEIPTKILHQDMRLPTMANRHSLGEAVSIAAAAMDRVRRWRKAIAPIFTGRSRNAVGVTYVFNKAAVFMGIFLFPSLFAMIGQANATLFVILFPVIGLLAAIFMFREVYGFQLD